MAALAVKLKVAAVMVIAAAGVSAQTSTETVWSSVAFVYHGERQPLKVSSSPALTPLGAQQMFAQGSVFRSRYLTSRTGGSALPSDLSGISGLAPIQGIERNAIDNQQLNILSNTDNYMAAGALAFMQGLYPPMNQSFSNTAGGIDSAELFDGSLVNFPLDGYQYPKLQTFSPLDPNVVWLQGHVNCLKYDYSAQEMRSEPDMRKVHIETGRFYESLWNKFFRWSGFVREETDFYNAYRLYDYALYNYTHENSTRQILSSQDLSQLGYFASIQQRNLNGNLSASGVGSPGDRIRAIGGRMLARRVIDLLRDSIAKKGQAGKLNLIFGFHDPFLAFFALSGLYRDIHQDVFTPLPRNGAVMVFEAFTVGGSGGSNPSYPSPDDLWVRFLYRNGTDPGAVLTAYPLFGNGNSQGHMPYRQFERDMDAAGLPSITDWCLTCGTTATSLCRAASASADGSGGVYTSGGGSGSGSGSAAGRGVVTPPVAGAIGAVCTLALLGLAVAAAAFLFGVRLTTTSRGGPDKGTSSSSAENAGRGGGGGSGFFGGFKGPEKRSDDPDVAYAKGGVRHERSGSWELRGGGGGGGEAPPYSASAAEAVASGASVARGRDDDAALKETAVMGTSDRRGLDDDTISLFSAKPVQARESV